MRSTNDLDPLTVSSTPTGGISLRWAPPERLGPERFGSTVDDPGKKSDMYSMGMTIYEVSFLQFKPGRNIEVALGSHGQDPILRA